MTEPLVIMPAAAIIDVPDAKARVPALADADDAVVEAQIAVATQAAENYTGKAIGVQTLEWRPDECCPYYHHLNSPYWLTNGPWGWRGIGSSFFLPKPPLVYDADDNPVVITYLDSAGDEQTYDAANYIVSGVGGKGRITLKSGSTWPTLGSYPEALRIQYVAGFATVPEPIVQAILIAAADGYDAISGGDDIRSITVEGSGSVTYGTASTAAAFAATTGDQQMGVLSRASKALLDPYREF